MCVTSSERFPAPRRERGFTLVELVVILVLLGTLAVVVLPKLGTATGLRDDAWREDIRSALRFAHKTAMAQRRLVCASITSTAVTLTVASANPAAACNRNLAGPQDSSGVFATNAGSATVAVAPAGMLYFQSDGRVTSDAAGTSAVSRTITVSGTAGLTLVGETGHVD